MSNDLLATIGISLANIGGAIAECARHAGQGSAPPVQHFEECLSNELLRLRGVGEDGIAAALEGLRHPVTRLMSQGW